MAVITFPGLVVVADDAHTIDDKGQPILESVRRPRQHAWQMPDHEFGKRPIIKA